MCKENFAASVTINMPYRGANKQELLLPYMFIVAIHISNISIVPSIMFHRAGSRRLATAPARAEGPPQAFRRSSPTHSRVEDGGPNSHNRAVRAGDSTALRYQRASSQSRTRPAEQKKTARSVVTHLIPTRAGEDYEVLREQLFGIERPGASAARFSVLVRCGLAAWALGRHDLATLPPHVPLASVRTPAEHVTAGSLLVKLIANLILSPRQEAPPCRT